MNKIIFRIDSMKEFTIIELASCIGAILANIAMVCGVVQKSKCKKVKLGCIECERDERAIELDLERRAEKLGGLVPIR